ncbi:S-adenosylmethionine decarboxylase [Trypanosoma rangeli]|uniref:S-adenosylmethionine decarboxylase proenzyme n=1 Tax=Trypanosoma rangeli TaxID=5698 RepID=A0A422P0V0_TRYRA|nr:S-adenosylmethionine decarboxylase [Trypanosoma rangeli]RNF11321.1 S-adenosylmethionine decarboxylase [Trypanosoma rangeli]|eukprot:RNF11321.1 S-adenosylmethionine decarboxylase [Trypanosoma rangeli]
MPGSKDPFSLMAMWGSVRSYDPKQGANFEGPEKRLEVIMRFLDETHVDGLYAVGDEVWTVVVGSLNAQIVSKESNEFIRSYVLTESSLFVMRDRIILITCGTTTLLHAVPYVLEVVSNVRGEVEWASFMHKNYSFPWEQKGPHLSMAEEFNSLRTYFPAGRPFIFGPVDSDHYFLFVYDDIIRPSATENDTQLSMTMYGLNRAQTKHWYSDRFISTGPETAAIRRATSLDRVVDDSWKVHDLQFEPCGYSVNTIRGAEYQTIHITPEDHCSFASYETNTPVANYAERISTVLGVFSPQRFSVIVFLDPDSAVGKMYQRGENVGVEAEYFPEYELQNRTVNEFTPGCVVLKMNYTRKTTDTEAISTSAVEA